MSRKKIAKSPSKKMTIKRSVKKHKADPIDPKDLMSQMAVVTSNMFVGDILPQFNPSALVSRKGLQIYDRMRNDDQIKAALWFKKLAIVSTGWEVISPGNKPEDWEVTRFVRDQFDNIERSFMDCIVEILSALDYGFSCSEKIYFPTPKDHLFPNKIGLRAIKSKKPHGISFKMDEFGTLDPDGIVQQGGKAGGNKLPVGKFVIYSHQFEFSNYYGKSDLEAVYRSWWVKENAYRWLAMLLERFGIPPIFALYEPESLTEKQINDLLTVIERIQAATAGALPRASKDSLELWAPQLAGQAQRVFIPALEMFNRDIARGLLMPGLMGLTPDQQVGSFARARVIFDAFMLMISRTRRQIEDLVVTEQVLRPLVDLNYAIKSDEYPMFRFLPITDDLRLDLMKQWGDFVGAGVTEAQVDDEEHIRKLFAFPKIDKSLRGEEILPDDDLEDDDEPVEDDDDEDEGGDEGGDDDGDDGDSNLKIGKPEKLASEQEEVKTYVPRTTPNRFEKQVDFKKITKTLDDLERNSVKNIVEAMVDVRNRFLKHIESKFDHKVAFVRQLASLRGMPKVSQAIGEFLEEAFDQGTVSVRNELSGVVKFQDAPNFKPTQAIKFLKTKTFWITGIIDDSLRKEARGILLNSIENGEPLRETMRKLKTSFEPYVGDPSVIRSGRVISPSRLETIVRTNTTDAFNRGRLVEARAAEDLVTGFEFSAVIDAVTCFHGDTLVVMADGIRKEIRSVRPGDKVLSGCGRERRVRAIKVSLASRWCIIKMEGSAQIRTTITHPFWTIRSGSYCWVQAADLSTNDRVGTIELPKLWEGDVTSQKQEDEENKGREILQSHLLLRGNSGCQSEIEMCRLWERSSQERVLHKEERVQDTLLLSEMSNSGSSEGCLNARSSSGMSNLRKRVFHITKECVGEETTTALFEGMSEAESLEKLSNLRTAIRDKDIGGKDLLFTEMLSSVGSGNETGKDSERGIGSNRDSIRARRTSREVCCGLYSRQQDCCGSEWGILAPNGQEESREEKNERSKDEGFMLFQVDSGERLKSGQKRLSERPDHSIAPTPTDSVVVTSIRNFRGLEVCYDLEIERDHTYLVGPGIIVHNTEVCQHLDGKIIRSDDPNLDILKPPRHYNCRSLLVPITLDVPVKEDEFLTKQDGAKGVELSGESFGGPARKGRVRGLIEERD